MMEYKQIPADCTLRQYREQYATQALYEGLGRWCKISICVALAGMLLGLLLNPVELVLNAVFLAAEVKVIAPKRSKACVLALTIAGAAMVPFAMLSGLGWLICGIGMLGVFKKIDAEYTELMTNLKA